MQLELQIQSSILENITVRAVQSRLFTACFPPFGSDYADHADVAPGPLQLTAANARVRIRVPVDVFIVSRQAVLAAPNGVPTGATAKALTVVLVLEMSVGGTVVSLEAVDVEGAPGSKNLILQAFGPSVNFDLFTMLNALGMPAPAFSRVELAGTIVAIRFEPTNNAVSHLFPGQDWGFFVDSVSVEQLATSAVPPALRSRLNLDPHWRPAGDKPHVDIDYAVKFPVPDPFSAGIDGVVACDFSLSPPGVQGLRTTVNWSLNVNIAGAPGVLEDELEDYVVDEIESQMDPRAFGGTPLGGRAFVLDNLLTDVGFGGARFYYGSVLASSSGMTIGGPVHLPLDPGQDVLDASVSAFGLPLRLTTCRVLAKSGSGDPPKTVSLSEVKTYGSVELEGFGRLCHVEIVSPVNGEWLNAYVKQSGDSPEVMIAIPSAVALGIAAPVRLIIRTARGVRLYDLGIPPPVELNAEGLVTNARLIHTPNCLYVNVDHSIAWARAGGLLDQTVVNPPLEHPDWKAYLSRHRGIDVQLVTLFALDPGELIQFRSRDHSVNVTADRSGRALVPVLLPVANGREGASLIRVNRRSIAGHFTVRTAIFMDQAGLPAGTKHDLTSVDGKALLTIRFKDRVDVHEMGRFGVPVLLKREQTSKHESSSGIPVSRSGAAARPAGSAPLQPLHGEAALNPQPLPPVDTPALSQEPFAAWRMNLSGFTSLLAVPGFAEAPIALATARDGSVLVLDYNEEGTFRVAGTFDGPVGILDVAGDWAVSADANRISIYRVMRG
jgi:hypothetical protein